MNELKTSSYAAGADEQWFTSWGWGIHVYTEKNFDFCVEFYRVIESSRIKYLQDSRPESFWYYSTIHGTRWKFSRRKTEYINELYYIIFFIKIEKNIFNSFFTEIFVLKLLTKISVKKLSNILLSIKIENNISNSFFNDIFGF